MSGADGRDSGSARRPNIVMILTDDHASHAVGAYGSVVNRTPWIDEIAALGVRFENCFATNALCSPSRASILTGTYSHMNGVSTLATPIDASQPTFVSLLRESGYRTAIVGKWHMGDGDGHDPENFDYFFGDLTGEPTNPPAEGMYYRYWEHDDPFHKAPAHYGYRSGRYKIIYFYNDGMGIPGTGSFTYSSEWELYDLQADPDESRNVYFDPAYRGVREEMKVRMWKAQAALADRPHPSQPTPAGMDHD